MSEYPGYEQPVVEGKPRRRGWLTCVIVALVVLLVACIAVAVVLVVPAVTGEPVLPFLPPIPTIQIFPPTPTPTPTPGPVSGEVLLAFPGRNDADLYLLNVGQDPEEQGVLLAEDVETEEAYVILTLVEGGRQRQVIGGYPTSSPVAMEAPISADGTTWPVEAVNAYDYGGFVPGSDRLFLWYRLEDELVLQQMRIGDAEPAEVLESEDAWRLSGAVLNDPELVFVTVGFQWGNRCYVAGPGEEADRVASGRQCSVSTDGRAMILVDEDGTGLSVADLDGENETMLVDNFRDVGSYRISDDASHAAYTRLTEEGVQLYLVEQGNKPVTLGEPVFRLVDYGFAPGGDTLFYLAEEVEHNRSTLRLYVVGRDEPVAEGPALGASFTPDGQFLVYVVGDADGEQTLYVHPLSGGRDVEVLSGQEVNYAVLDTSPPRILALSVERGEYVLSSASTDGGDVVALFSGGADLRIEYEPGGSLLYVFADEHGATSLFVTPVDQAAGSALAEEWVSVDVLNRSPAGDRVVFWGQESFGDSPALYSVATADGAEPVELDDDGEAFRNAIFSEDGQYVLYTAVTGSGSDDVEVRQVRADGEEDPEVLYEEALLVDARWGDIDPYMLLSWQTAATAQFVPETVYLRWFIGLGTGTDSDQVAVAEEVVEEFNASQDYVVLELEVYENDIALDTLRTMIAAGDPPDIVGPVSTYKSNELYGMWLDLAPYLADYDLGDFHPAALDAWRREDEGLIGLPIFVYPSFIYYNRDLFDQAGLPYPPHRYGEPYADGDEWTVEKLEEIAMQLTVDARGNDATHPSFDPDNIVQFGFVPQWTDLRGEMTMFGAGSFVDEDGNAVIPEHWRAALHWYYEGMWEKHFIPNASYQYSDLLDFGNSFNSGNVAMAHCHLWYTCCLWTLTANWDIAAVPSYNGVTTARLHTDMLGVLNTTLYPEEAVEALYYLATSQDLIEAWRGGYGMLPALKSMQADYLDRLEGDFPGVDWHVALDSLNYIDVPSHEDWMPNFSQAVDRIAAFHSLYRETPGLDLDVEIDQLVADLQEIFK